MAITTKDDAALDPQILVDTIRGYFKGKNAFIGSPLVANGAVMVSGTMPNSGNRAIGQTVDVPYFGTVGEFTSNADGSSVTPSKLVGTSESATVSRHSLAVETSRWAQGLGSMVPGGDPFSEAAEQVMQAASRKMDSAIVDKVKDTPLVRDVYSSSSPHPITWQDIIRSKVLWGDEQDQIVAMVMHSQVEADAAELTDSSGRPLLLTSMTQGQGSITTFAGVPVVVSDRVPLEGSTMGSVTSSGSTPPTVTLSGEPKGAYNLKIDITTGGSSDGTAKFKFSTDNGNTYSAELTVPSGGGTIELTDTAADSLVGQNGETGITADFANGTYNADNEYTATANLKASTLLLQRGAAAFWYNADALAPKQDVDILADTDILAMHLYHAAHMYRRRRGGSRPGVVNLKTNVRNFAG